MNPENAIIICPQCGTKNRIPMSRWGDRAFCGKCRTALPFFRYFPGQIVEVTDQTFKSEVLDFPGPVLLEFFAPWCGYCQRLAPLLDQIASEYAGRVKFAKLNVDKNFHTASQYAIKSTPTLFFFKEGRLVARLLGAQPRGEIERHLTLIL